MKINLFRGIEKGKCLVNEIKRKAEDLGLQIERWGVNRKNSNHFYIFAKDRKDKEVRCIIKETGESKHDIIWVGIMKSTFTWLSEHSDDAFIIIIDKLKDKKIFIPFKSIFFTAWRTDDHNFKIRRDLYGYSFEKDPTISLDEYIDNIDSLFTTFNKNQGTQY